MAEYAMKVVMVTILVIVVVLVLILMMGSWSSQAQGGVNNFFDFFGGIVGGSEPLPK